MEVAPQPVLELLHAGFLCRGGVYAGRVGHLWTDLRGSPSLCGAEGPPLNHHVSDPIPWRLCPRCISIATRLALPVPACPDCHSIVTRPHCLFDLPPDQCPRHSLREDWRRRQQAAIEKRRTHARSAR